MNALIKKFFNAPLLLGGSALLAALFMVSCIGDGMGVDEDGCATCSTAAYAKVQQIFDNKCTNCHTGIASGGLDLSAGNSYNMLVNTTTFRAPTVFPTLRVVPYSPDSSFLYEKISSDNPKDSSSRMPMVGPALPQSDIDIIANWISCGAPGPSDNSVCEGVND